MKLSFQQINLYRAYDDARQKGGAMTDSGWTDFDELPIPHGYTEDWAQEDTTKGSGAKPEIDRLLGEMQRIRAGSGEAKPERGVADSTQSINQFREWGKIGGQLGGSIGGKARAAKLSKEQLSAIGRMGGRGRRK